MFGRGQLIADRFRLINPIGRGALGELWRAVDRVPDRQVAIRRVSPFDEGASRRMLIEADAARAVRDKCIARVHRVGTLDDGHAFIASELLVSESLDDLLSRRGLLSPGAALTLVADLARGVAAAHERHLAHRAISPRTVLLHRDERGAITPKLVDFGRIAVLDAISAYASPEQLTDDTGRGYESDVWALGVMLFRCVTGKLPFRYLADAFEADSVVRETELPEPVRSVLASALCPIRGERATAAQLADSAQLAAWRVSGGFRDLEKMVRIHAPVWLDAAASGVVQHCPTIPALGGSPPPRPTEPPAEIVDDVEAVEDVEELDEIEEIGEIGSPRVSSLPPTRREPSRAPEPPPARYLTPIPDEVFIDFRQRPPRRAVIAAVGAAAAFCIGAITALSEPAPHRYRIGDVAIGPATVAAKPAAAPRATVAAVVQAIVPRHAALTTQTTPARTTKKAAADDTPAKTTTPYPIVGVPLWDGPAVKDAPKPKPKPPVDDNPYN